jgi:hypothetical protein
MINNNTLIERVHYFKGQMQSSDEIRKISGEKKYDFKTFQFFSAQRM